MEQLILGRLRQIFLFVFILTGVSPLLSIESWAYIPPSEFILKVWLNKHAGAKAIRIKSTVTAYDQDKPTPYRFREITQVDFTHSKIRSWATDENDNRLYSIEKPFLQLSPTGKVLLSTEGRDTLDSLKSLELPILTDSELAPYKTQMERVGAEKTFLSRWQGKVAWVIGEMEKPQIWFEKDLFFPLRFIFAQNGDPLEIQFDSIRSAHPIPYPKTIYVTRPGKGIRLSSQLDQLIPLSGGESQSSAHRGSGMTEAGNSSSSAIRELIRLYYDVLR